jgi:BatD DUF11 like domain
LVTAGGRLGALLALTLAGSPFAASADVSIRAEVDATKLGVQDQLQLTITVEGEAGGDVALPPLRNLRQVGGPYVSSQVSIVNGAISQSKSYTFVLQPIAPGQAEIGAAHVAVGGSEKATAPISVAVVPGAIRQHQAQPANPFEDDADDPFASLFSSRRPRAQPKLEAMAVASRARVHVGEPVLLTYYLYTQTSVTGVQLAQAPQYPGFWAEDLEQPKAASQGQRVELDGVSYARFPILRKLLFPTKAGTLTIPPARFRFGLQTSFFDAGPGSVERSTKPLTVTAEAVPVTPGFSGAVGSFRVSAAFDRDTVPLGDAATLRFMVQGAGNLKWIDHPPDVTIPGAKVYPPQSKSDLNVGPDGMTGSKTWEFVVVPQTSGTLEVPGLAFAYFDPSAGVMKQANTAPLSLKVPGAAAGTGSPAAPAATAAAPAAGLPLRSDLDLSSHVVPVVGQRELLLGLGLALLLHGAIGAASLISDRRRTTSGRPAARRSVRQALAELARARGGGLSKEQAAALIERTLHEVFGPIEDGASASAGSREQAIQGVLQEVQFLRFAPQLGDYSEKIREVARRAADVVGRWA